MKKLKILLETYQIKNDVSMSGLIILILGVIFLFFKISREIAPFFLGFGIVKLRK